MTPKIFSEDDRKMIRNTLLDAGKRQFLQYGLRKTNIEALANAAGIAKGTFYNFFDSKEDLCLEIFDIEQQSIKSDIEAIIHTMDDPTEIIKAIMSYNLNFVRSDSLLGRLRELNEIAILSRGVRAAKMEQHLREDNDLTELIITGLSSKGVHLGLSPDVLGGILRALVLTSMHEKEIGQPVFDQVLEHLFDWIGTGLIKNGTES